MFNKNRVPALTIIMWMDSTLHKFICQDGVPTDENSRDLQTIVRHRWPYLNDHMIQHHKVVESVAEELCRVIEDRKTQMDEGLISCKEFIQLIVSDAHWALESVEHILD